MRARGRARPGAGGRRARFRGAAAAVALVAAAAAAGAAARGVLVLLAGEARGAGGHRRESRGLLADAAGGAETFPFAWTALFGGTAPRRPLPRADLFVTPFGDASARALEKASDPSAATPFQVKSVTVARVGPSVATAQNATAREHAAAVVARAAQLRAFDTAQRARRVRMVREIFALAGTVETSIAGDLSSGRTAASWRGMARRDSSSADRIRGMSRGAMRSANAHTDVVRADYGWIDLTPATLSSSVAELNQLAATARLAQRTIVDDKRNGPAQLLYSGGDKRFNAFHANIPQMTFAVAERGNASSVVSARVHIVKRSILMRAHRRGIAIYADWQHHSPCDHTRDRRIFAPPFRVTALTANAALIVLLAGARACWQPWCLAHDRHGDSKPSSQLRHAKPQAARKLELPASAGGGHRNVRMGR